MIVEASAFLAWANYFKQRPSFLLGSQPQVFNVLAFHRRELLTPVMQSARAATSVENA